MAFMDILGERASEPTTKGLVGCPTRLHGGLSRASEKDEMEAAARLKGAPDCVLCNVYLPGRPAAPLVDVLDSLPFAITVKQASQQPSQQPTQHGYVSTCTTRISVYAPSYFHFAKRPSDLVRASQSGPSAEVRPLVRSVCTQADLVRNSNQHTSRPAIQILLPPSPIEAEKPLSVQFSSARPEPS